jgi:hypothetical protein
MSGMSGMSGMSVGTWLGSFGLLGKDNLGDPAKTQFTCQDSVEKESIFQARPIRLPAAKNSAPGRTELGGQLIKGQLGSANDNGCNGSIVRRSRLGGLLNYYHREAA